MDQCQRNNVEVYRFSSVFRRRCMTLESSELRDLTISATLCLFCTQYSRIGVGSNICKGGPLDPTRILDRIISNPILAPQYQHKTCSKFRTLGFLARFIFPTLLSNKMCPLIETCYMSCTGKQIQVLFEKLENNK